MKPILFNTEMVKKILLNQKTQTRRVIIPQPFEVEELTRKNGKPIYGTLPCRYDTDDKILWVREKYKIDRLGNVVYATDPVFDLLSLKCKPSIFMRKKYCRIFLKTNSITIERIKDITDEDIVAEGIDPKSTIKRELFIKLWNDINALRGYSWNVNPFVWIIKFERMQ